MLLVARVVHARDDLRDSIALPRELADDQVVLVVARHGEDELGRPRDPGQLEDVQLGRVAVQDLVLELVLELVEPRRALLDQRHLVPGPQQRAGDVRADLAASGDDGVHARYPAATAAALRTRCSSSEIAVWVGQTVSIPRAA